MCAAGAFGGQFPAVAILRRGERCVQGGPAALLSPRVVRRSAAVCVDESVSWKRKSDGHDHADIDAAIAAEHICLAAAEQGLGSCWVCNFDVPLCREALELPATLRPVVLIPVGYPADAPTQKKRKSPDEVAEWR